MKVTQSCLTLWTPWTIQSRNSPGQNTGVGSHSLFQEIFPTQGSNPGLLHCRRVLYQLSHKGSPKILEWVAYPFSSKSSRPRNGTRVSCIAGRFFTNWAIKEALKQSIIQQQNKQTFERARIARGSPAVPALNCLSLPSLGPKTHGSRSLWGPGCSHCLDVTAQETLSGDSSVEPSQAPLLWAKQIIVTILTHCFREECCTAIGNQNRRVTI